MKYKRASYITSFRYAGKKRSQQFARFFMQLAAQNGMRCVSTRTRRLPRFTEEGLAWAEAEIFHKVGELAPKMNKSRLKALSKPVQVRRLFFKHRNNGNSMIIDYATQNKVLCLGADLWIAKRLRLPGGFVEFRFKNQESIAPLVLATWKFCGHPLEKSDLRRILG